MVGRSSTGKYLMSGAIAGGQIYVYDAGGSLLRTIGRKGGGPGEFGALLRIAVGAGDTLFVIDDSQQRVQVLTPGGEFVRSFAARARSRSFALLGNGDLLFHHPPAHPDDFLFYRVDAAGTDRARFGKPTLQELDLETWFVSPRTPRGFWAASIWRYQVHRWNDRDSLELTIVRDADWFPPGETLPDGVYRSVPPPPFLNHIWEDTAGRLWTYVLVPDPQWTAGLRMRPSPEWFRRTFDTIIEVIDVQSGQLIASGRYDGRLGMVCGSHLMYTVVEDDRGDTRVQVLEPTLVRPD